MDSSRKRLRCAEDKFVTVVAVEEDGSGGERCSDRTHKSDADFVSSPFSEVQQNISRESSESDMIRPESNRANVESQPRPQPAPRQFVTVVSVGGTERLEMTTDGKATLESSLRVRLDVSQEATKDESQENIVTGHCQKASVAQSKKTSSAESRVPDQVVVFRLPGERLGLGLKFDGGMGATEKVQRLFIQSVAPDSPAARATVPWGDLEVGDQILHIEGRHVSSMTRVECVSLLKEASVKLTIGVLKGNGNIPETEECSSSPPSSQMRFHPCTAGLRLKRVAPPPLPPRLRPRKSPARPPKEATEWPRPPHGFEDLVCDASVGKVACVSRTSSFTDDWDGEVTALMAQSSRDLRLPPTPSVYLDLLSEEDRASRARCESESDETNSSASTVVDRLSISSSRTVSRNSSFNAAADAAKFDLVRALSPFEHLEKEINSERRKRSFSTPHLSSDELTSCVTDPTGTKETSENCDPLNGKSDIASDIHCSSKSSPKVKVKSTMKSLSFSLKSRPFSWHNNKNSSEDKSKKTDALSKKSNKRQAPLPPPRSVSSVIGIANSETTSKGTAPLHDKFDVATMNASSHPDKPEGIDITAQCDNIDFCEVFENEDFPSIVEKTTESPLDSVSIDNISEPSFVEGSSLLDSILRETKTRLENMKSNIYSSTGEARCEEFAETVTLESESLVSLDNRSPVDEGFYFSETDSAECAPTDNDGKLVTQSSTETSALTDSYDGCRDEDEPLNTDTYEVKKECFIDRVSNPAYGFPPLARERKRDQPKIEPEDELYEEVNTSPVHFPPASTPIVHRGDPQERNGNESDPEYSRCSSDISSVSSRSLSSISLSSREMEETAAEDVRERRGEERDKAGSISSSKPVAYNTDDVMKEEDHLPLFRETLSPTKEDPVPEGASTEAGKSPQDEQNLYDYVDVLPPRDQENVASIRKRIAQTSSQVRLREDLGQLLREELSLGQDAHVEVEEEEIVESVVECETEEELLLVLRALRSDNSLFLDEQCEGEGSSLESRLAASSAEGTPKPPVHSGITNPTFLSQRSGRKGLLEDVTEGSDTLTLERGVSNGCGRSQKVIVKGRDGRMSVESSPLVLEEGIASETAPISECQPERQSGSPSDGSTRRKSLTRVQVTPEGKEDCSWCRIQTKDPAFLSTLLKPFSGEGSFGATDIVEMVARSPSSTPEIKVPGCPMGPLKSSPAGEADADTCAVSSCHAPDDGHRNSTASSRPTEEPPVDIPGAGREIGSLVNRTRATKRAFQGQTNSRNSIEEAKEEAQRGGKSTAPLFDSPSAEKGRAVESESHFSSSEWEGAGGPQQEPPPVEIGAPAVVEHQSLSDVIEKENLVIPLRGGGTNVTLYERRFASTSSQSSPPPYSRLPPDGHEFPSSYSEVLQDKIERAAHYSGQQEAETEPSARKTSSGGSPSTLPRSPPKLSSIPPPSEGRSTSRWRRQDERSERSVRDKIAMFSSEKERNKAKSRKIDHSESVHSGHNEKTCMKRSLTEDDVRIESSGRDVKLSRDSPENKQSSRKQGKPSVYSSMINVHSSDSDSKENVKPASSEADVRETNSSKGGNNTELTAKSTLKVKQAKEAQEESLSGLNSRSQSLIDIGKPTRMKRHSVGAYDRPSVYKYGVEKPEERERRTSLNNMIEQRRKSMSKLRGLVIPETRVRDCTEGRSPLDLPRISSNASQNYKTMSLPRDETKISSLYKADSVSSIDSCSSSASRHSITPTSHSGKGITKLSPAHNRKLSFGTSKSDSLPPLSSRATRNQSPLSDFSGSTSTLTTISPQRSFDRSATPNSENSFEMDNKYCSDRSVYSRTHTSLRTSQDSRLSRSEDSDNDSAVSSTQSSFSQSLSPRASPMPDHYDHEDRHSPTRSSRSRHSPQSSYDELESKRVLKSGSIEAENRRNILKSAKCSSGRSSDEQSTPEIVRKFSKDRTPELFSFTDRLDSELQEGPKKTHLKREESIESSSSVSSQHSSLESSRCNSKDSVIHVNSKQSDSKVSAQAVYFDLEGDMYKESQVKVAYLNEVVDEYEQLPDERGSVVSEIPLQNNPWLDETSSKAIVSPTTYQDGKWNALENKYSSLKQEHESIENKISKYISSSEANTSERYRYGVSTTKADFRALADKWKQRIEEDPTPRQPHALVRTDSATRVDKASKREDPLDAPNGSRRQSRSEKGESLGNSESTNENARFYESREERPNTLNLPRTEIPDRKFSVPEYGSGLKLREKREVNSGDIPSRPTSLIEGTSAMETLQQEGQYMTPLSPSTSTDSREDLLDSSEASLSRTGSKEVLDAFSKATLSSCVTPKMSEIMRALERHDIGSKGLNGSHPRMSSMDSNGSDDGSQGAHYGSASSLASGQRDQYGSITSLSSSTSIISPQELAQLIEEANYSLEESGTPSHEILVVVLHREIVGQGSIGITLAGGADYETKEITVHKVIPGSLADRDGRIQKGDRILSINGKTLRGVSHREALNILKSPRPEVVLVLSRSRSVTPQESTVTQSNGDAEGGFSHRSVFINHVPPPRPPKILESPMDSKSLVSDLPVETVPRGPPMNITLLKDGAGLGFSLEGGKDSPLGDRPLTVKKVFSGGAADKGGVLKVGDELLGVNSVDLTNMARIEAWNFLKKLPDGKVNLVIRQKARDDDKELKN